MIQPISTADLLADIRSLPHGDRRVLLAGWPRSGKTTVAKWLGQQLHIRVRHTDELIVTHAWSELSEAASTWFDEPGNWVIEGTPVARALRKWLSRTPERKPAELVVLCRNPLVELSKGQAAMGKGSDTVWLEIEEELARRRVKVALLTSIAIPFDAEARA